ncbi:hypothetical protein Tco_0705697 [Tanacetum coccineum]|uniref:Uncharacterized protein n=1 Tax=Tanacetum coccineum TaxID=301880 RepID=A0ABQ4Y6V6_9ASTR
MIISRDEYYNKYLTHQSGGGVVDLTGDEDPTDEDGDIGVSASLGVEIFLEGKKCQESNIGDSDNTGDCNTPILGQLSWRTLLSWRTVLSWRTLLSWRTVLSWGTVLLWRALLSWRTNREPLPEDILGVTIQRAIKEILGDTTQRDIEEILGDTTQRDIEEILGDTTQRDIEEILGDTTQRDIEEILGDTTQRDIEEILGDTTQRDIGRCYPKRYFHSGGGVVNLTGDEDPTDEDGDIGVLVSLGDEIFSEGKESRESNIGDSDNTGDGGKTAGRAIITWGGGISSFISQSEGRIVE